MKTKEEGWIKGDFEVNLAYEEGTKQIENGRIYKCFGIDMSNKQRTLYHLPTKRKFATYEKTLREIKELVDRVLEINIDWTSTDNLYYHNIDRDLAKQIYKIQMEGVK